MPERFFITTILLEPSQCDVHWWIFGLGRLFGSGREGRTGGHGGLAERKGHWIDERRGNVGCADQRQERWFAGLEMGDAGGSWLLPSMEGCRAVRPSLSFPIWEEPGRELGKSLFQGLGLYHVEWDCNYAILSKRINTFRLFYPILHAGAIGAARPHVQKPRCGFWPD